ncbi:MAG: TolC family protein [Terrimicrobiaceae bacterium]|nr:TolC family protein [Terrimicrobiaceae bacterium]
MALALVLGPAARGELADPDALPSLSPAPQGHSPVRSAADFLVLRKALEEKPYAVFSQAELGMGLERISAIRSVQLTLEANPQILFGDARVVRDSGAVQVAEGAFDTLVRASVRIDATERSRTQLARPTPSSSPGTAPAVIPNPLVARTNVFEYEAGLQKRLENGIVVRPGVLLRHATNKDTGQFNNENRRRVNFVVTIPLGRGGGTLVNKAPELAARFDLLASILQLRFITTQSVQTTLQAYWRLRGAEETYKLRVESEEISRKLASVSAQLVEADELAPAQLPQVLADRDSAIAARIQAENELIRARQTLAVASGWSPGSLLLAPLAADTFPEVLSPARVPEIGQLVTAALNLRDDLRSSREVVKSRKILMDAAWLEMRPTVNLQFDVGYAPFETRNNATTAEGGEWRGVGQFLFEYPIENNSARGTYIQNAAAYQNSEISEEQTERNIVAGVITSYNSLRAAGAAVARLSAAVRFNEEALRSQEELFRLGQGTLTDTITSRERLVQSQLSHISAQAEYAISLVNLRFETGTLFFSDAEGDWIESEVWLTPPFAGRDGRSR